MSNNMYCFMEVKDRNNNWQLVKYVENMKYNESDHEHENFGEEYYKIQYPFELKRTIDVGCELRDALSMRTVFNQRPLPNDISTELMGIIEDKTKSENSVIPVSYYKTHYYCISFAELYEIYESRYNLWKDLLNRNIEYRKNNFLMQKIDNAKKEIICAINNVDFNINESKENQEEEKGPLCYEDSFDYAVGEGLKVLMGLREQINAIRSYAVAYSGDKFINEDNIRIYCFY